LAVVQAYYDGIRDFANIKNYRMAIEMSFVEFMKERVLEKETDNSRILYAPNENCFRKRLEQTTTNNLDMPFVNYKLKTFQYDNSFNWNQYVQYEHGIYLEELGQVVKIMPVLLEYEATFWCNRDDELRYATTNTIFKQGASESKIEYNVTINNNQLQLLGKQTFSDTGIDSEYTERDWLEKNKIHSLSLSSEIKTFVFLTDTDISITEQALLEFTSIHTVDDEYAQSEQFIVSQA